MPNELTKKQESFAQEYVKCGNATEAYKKVYNASNMKAETIHVKASELLKNGKVSVRVGNLQKVAGEVAEEKFKIDSESILKQLHNLANSNIGDYVRLVKEKKFIPSLLPDGEDEQIEIVKLEFKPFDELTEDQLLCIKSIKNGKNGIELELHDKSWTIEKISKHIGFYEKDNDQKKIDFNNVKIGFK